MHTQSLSLNVSTSFYTDHGSWHRLHELRACLRQVVLLSSFSASPHVMHGTTTWADFRDDRHGRLLFTAARGSCLTLFSVDLQAKTDEDVPLLSSVAATDGTAPSSFQSPFWPSRWFLGPFSIAGFRKNGDVASQPPRRL